MLKKVVSIEGLGLLHSSGVSPAFQECTLLFADNGKGKSTFTTLLESLRTGDMGEVSRLQTIDQTSAVQAKLIFDDGRSTSEIVTGAWDHLRPNVRVFDSRFVRENVHSGSLVESSHRRNLLTFVLGDSAVVESGRERRATEELAAASADVRAKEDSLSPLLNGSTLNEFIAFSEDNDIATKISAVETDIGNHKAVAEILAQPLPAIVGLLDPNLDAVFNILARGLEGVHDSASVLVQEHVSNHPQPDFEAWLRTGASFQADETCPYCTQTISGSPLIIAYRQFFSQEYFEHVEQIAALSDVVAQSIGPQVVQALTRRVAEELLLTNSWKARLPLDDPSIDVAGYQEHFTLIWRLISESIEQKVSAPLTELDVTELRRTVGELWVDIESSFSLFNASVAENADSISALKEGLTAGDLPALEIARAKLEAQRIRHTPTINDVVTGLIASRGRARRHEVERNEARSKVRVHMDDTLSRYQSKINGLLGAFGASFSVKEMRTNFRGVAPQSEYVILLRSKEVPLKSDTGPNFDTALSEGDKRTLAFAFFVACVLGDPEVATMTVAVDDPMSSMDAGRRLTTIRTLIDLQAESAQLILSSHDSVFLRDFRMQLARRLPLTSVAEIQLIGGLGGYSAWEQASIDDLSESARRKTLRAVEEFVRTGQGDAQSAASNIRPMLEGYLHSRFPTLLKDGLLLGESLIAIRQAVAPSPLVFALNIVDEIEEVNSYAGTFHHDGSAGYVRPIASTSEAQHYGERALRLIYSGNPIGA